MPPAPIIKQRALAITPSTSVCFALLPEHLTAWGQGWRICQGLQPRKSAASLRRLGPESTQLYESAANNPKWGKVGGLQAQIQSVDARNQSVPACFVNGLETGVS